MSCGALALACSLDESGAVSDSDASAGSSGLGGSGGGFPDATSSGGAGGSSGGAAGSAGSAAGAAGTSAGAGGSLGGASGSAGAAGASGGSGGAGGAGGAGGTGGAGGNPGVVCTNYPGSVAFTLPTGQTHCYWLVDVGLGFAAAHDACVAGGGYLATIHSPQENEHVRAMAFAVVSGGSRLWIGATDGMQAPAQQCMPYTWITGEPFSYQNWSNSSCNCSSGCCEHRGVMGNDGTWRTRCENDPFAYMCEVGALVGP